MSICNNQDISLKTNNDTLKRELSDFIDLLREKISDAAFDKNFIILKNELLALEAKMYATGSTVGRPLQPRVGQQYFDTTLNKPVFFSGKAWVDATGKEV